MQVKFTRLEKHYGLHIFDKQKFKYHLYTHTLFKQSIVHMYDINPQCYKKYYDMIQNKTILFLFFFFYDK